MSSSASRKSLALLAAWLLDGLIAMMVAAIASAAWHGHPLMACLGPVALLPLANLFRAGMDTVRIGNDPRPPVDDRRLLPLSALALVLCAASGAFMLTSPDGGGLIAAAAALLTVLTILHAATAPKYGALAKLAGAACIRLLSVAQIGLVVATVWLGRYGALLFLGYLFTFGWFVWDGLKAAEEERKP